MNIKIKSVRILNQMLFQTFLKCAYRGLSWSSVNDLEALDALGYREREARKVVGFETFECCPPLEEGRTGSPPLLVLPVE